MPQFRKLRPEELGGDNEEDEEGGEVEGMARLSESDVMDWVGAKSFQRGQAYAKGGHIFNTRRTGQTLKALCHGSQGGPYRVEVEVSESGLQGGTCSCPVGYGGRCKHAAAMLLVWMKSPDSFVAVQPLEQVLAQRSPEQLLSLIRQMVARYPDLESLIELPILSQDTDKPVKVSLLRNQIRAALVQEYDHWHDGYSDPAQELEPLLQLGEGYLNAQAWHNAITVFETMVREILAVYRELYDTEGEVYEVFTRCVDGLGDCLSNLDDPVEREPLLNTLFFIYQWNIDEGGIGMGEDAAEILGAQSHPEEKRLLAKRAHGALAGQPDKWTRQMWGAFLLQLEAETMDDETYLTFCREMGQTEELIERLLKLGRAEEAEAEAKQVQDGVLLHLTRQFIQHGQIERLLPHLRQRARRAADSALVHWLKGYATQQGNLKEALEWTEFLFWRNPSLQGYQELHALATQLERWASLRSALLAKLTEMKKQSLLLEIYLEEGAARQALDLLATYPSALGGWYSDLPLRVARLAEADYPLEAIAIYKVRAEQSIEKRSRQYYATAATYLVRVKGLYEKLGRGAVWKQYLSTLRTKYTTLRALHDELHQAGLL